MKLPYLTMAVSVALSGIVFALFLFFTHQAGAASFCTVGTWARNIYPGYRTCPGQSEALVGYDQFEQAIVCARIVVTCQ